MVNKIVQMSCLLSFCCSELDELFLLCLICREMGKDLEKKSTWYCLKVEQGSGTVTKREWRRKKMRSRKSETETNLSKDAQTYSCITIQL